MAHYPGSVPEIYTNQQLNDLFENYKRLGYQIQHWNPRTIFIPPADWAEERTITVIRRLTAEPESEDAMDATKFHIGDKVRKIKKQNGFIDQCTGVVEINSSLIALDVDFKALEIKGRAKPIDHLPDGPFPVDAELLERLAVLVFVAWYAPDGYVVCREWVAPEKLEESK
jgi:hypothetical protein